MRTTTGLTAILTLSLAVSPAAQTPPPRDPRTAAAAEAEAIRSLDAAVAEKRAPEAAYYQLAGLLEARGESERADAVLLSARDLFPRIGTSSTDSGECDSRRAL